MKAEATRAAERILETGGNAFDAIVAGQAVLGVVDAAMNGIGSDAVLLIYDAKAKKVVSLNAEGTAPKLATIEWYKKNNGGKLPQSDGLLAGTVPGMVDAWYILLDRWGTMSFEKCWNRQSIWQRTAFRLATSWRGQSRQVERSLSTLLQQKSTCGMGKPRMRATSFATRLSRER
jgi:gamma-glutamyltranspeptidase/glutathione hydrolase